MTKVRMQRTTTRRRNGPRVLSARLLDSHKHEAETETQTSIESRNVIAPRHAEISAQWIPQQWWNTQESFRAPSRPEALHLGCPVHVDTLVVVRNRDAFRPLITLLVLPCPPLLLKLLLPLPPPPHANASAIASAAPACWLLLLLVLLPKASLTAS